MRVRVCVPILGQQVVPGEVMHERIQSFWALLSAGLFAIVIGGCARWPYSGAELNLHLTSLTLFFSFSFSFFLRWQS